MATGSTDPFADLLMLQRDMDRIMARFGAQPRRSGEDGHAFWMPPVDVFKQGDDMVVRVELPGVNPADINVSVTGNMLTIKGERRQDQNRAEGDYVMQESSYGAFERRITMPEDIDAGQVRAQYRAGILEVTVPGSALIAAQPQKVQVGGAQQPAMGGQQAQQQYAQQQQYQQQQPGGQPQQQQNPQSEYEREIARYGRGPGEEPRGRAEGGYPQQGATQQPPEASQPQEQRPVEVQGGWVVPSQTQPAQQGGQPGQQQEPQGARPSQEQTGTSYSAEQETRPTEQQPEDERKRRSRLGGWLHGE